jgi:hypothetical protein
VTTPAIERSLRQVLNETLELLDGAGERFWSEKIRMALGGPIPRQQILSWYGGMGSFTDLMLSRVNGHDVRDEDQERLNVRLDKLQSRINELARQLPD